MPTVRIETDDGPKTVRFEGQPTEADIDEVAAQYRRAAPVESPDTAPRVGEQLTSQNLESQVQSALEGPGSLIPPETAAVEGGMMGGGLLAARAASMLPGIWPKAIGFLAGSTLGRMGGRAGVETARQLQGQDVTGATGRILGEAKPGLLGGAAGLAVPAALSTMARPFTKATPAAAATAAEAIGIGVSQTAGEATGNPLTAGLEAFSGRTLTGAPTIQRVAQRENEQLVQAAERYLARRLTPEEFGAATLEPAKRVEGLLRVMGREKFEVFKQQSQGLDATINARDLSDTAAVVAKRLEGLLEDIPAKERLQGILRQLEGLGTAQRPASTILAPNGQPAIPAGQMTVPVSVSELSNIYRDLTQIAPVVKKVGDRFAEGQIIYLKTQVDNAIKQATTGTPAEGLYQAAKTFWGEEVIPFQSRVGGPAKVLLSRKSESPFLDLVMNPRRPEVTKEFIKQMSAFEPQAVADLQTAVLTRVLAGPKMRDPTAVGTEILKPAAILREWEKIGPEIQQALFPTQRASIQAYMDVLKASQATQRIAGNPPQTGRAVIQAAQLAAVGAGLGVTGERRPEMYGAGVLLTLLGPYALARALTSPMTAQYVARGGRMLPQSEEFARILGQLGYSLTKTDQPPPATKRQPILFGPRERP